MSVNKAIIMGRLTRDPELKTIEGGNTVCNFSVATSSFWKDKAGNKQEKATFHNVVVWGKPAENCNRYLEKGKQVYIEGEIQNRTFDKKDGTKGYVSEIKASSVEFLGGGNKKVVETNESYTTDEIPF